MDRKATIAASIISRRQVSPGIERRTIENNLLIPWHILERLHPLQNRPNFKMFYSFLADKSVSWCRRLFFNLKLQNSVLLSRWTWQHMVERNTYESIMSNLISESCNFFLPRFSKCRGNLFYSLNYQLSGNGLKCIEQT